MERPIPSLFKLNLAQGCSSKIVTTKKTQFRSNSEFNKISKQDNVGNQTEPILAVYSSDYNIIRIHQMIINKLESDMTYGISELEKQLQLERSKVGQPQILRERTKSLNVISEMRTKIKDISSRKIINEYNLESSKLLTRYREIGPSQRKMSFIDGKIENDEDELKSLERIRVIHDYLIIAGRYLPISQVREIEYSYTCLGCDYPMDDVVVSDSGFQICPKCQTEHNYSGVAVNDKESSGGKTNYDNSDNFLKAFLRYIGEQPNKIHSELYDDIERYFISRGKPSGKDIRTMPHTKRGRKVGTDLIMLHDALQKTGHSDFYEDANLIAHNYWGWKLPEVKHLKDKIMKHYSLTQEVYSNLERERKSSIGTQLRLFKQLQLIGHECNFDDFKIPKSDSLVEQLALWKKMCDGCEDPEIYYIDSF